MPAQTDSHDVMIRFRGAGVTYPNGVVGLQDVTLDIRRGEFVVIVGSSGAGKSTFLRTINGLTPLSTGAVEVAGQPVPRRQGRELRQLRARIGMVFQDFRLVRRVSVLNNVLIGRVARVAGWRSVLNLWPREDIDLAFSALERVGIVDKAYTRAGQLSGGQQQRVGIARALAQEPEVILADEPVASLDPVTCHQVMEDLLRINRELGITTLVNLHFLDLARRYGQRIIGLQQGRLVFDGAGSDVTDADFQRIYGRQPEEDDFLQEARA